MKLNIFYFFMADKEWRLLAVHVLYKFSKIKFV